MMRGRDILRLPVVARDTGTRVGQLEDLIVDRQGAQVLGIVVALKGLWRGERVVAWGEVQAVGMDVVVINSEASLVKGEDVPEIKEVLDRGFVLQGSRVETTAGRELGRIENFFLDGTSGVVEGYELVGGLNEQQPSGRAFLPLPSSFEAGKEYTFVDPSVADTIEDLAAALKSRSK